MHVAVGKSPLGGQGRAAFGVGEAERGGFQRGVCGVVARITGDGGGVLVAQRGEHREHAQVLEERGGEGLLGVALADLLRDDAGGGGTEDGAAPVVVDVEVVVAGEAPGGLDE